MTELPYADRETGRSSGWSGSETSRERAHTEDANGTTTKRQRQALAGLSSHGYRGLTWKDLATLMGWHHGQASGVLSVLHKAGRIERLTERRQRCQVYVLPEFVGDRETVERTTTSWKSRALDAETEALRLKRLMGSLADGHMCTCEMTDPGVYHGDNMHPPEWEQDPWCPTHPAMEVIVSQIEALAARAAATGLYAEVAGWLDGLVPKSTKDALNRE